MTVVPALAHCYHGCCFCCCCCCCCYRCCHSKLRLRCLQLIWPPARPGFSQSVASDWRASTALELTEYPGLPLRPTPRCQQRVQSWTIAVEQGATLSLDLQFLKLTMPLHHSGLCTRSSTLPSMSYLWIYRTLTLVLLLLLTHGIQSQGIVNFYYSLLTLLTIIHIVYQNRNWSLIDILSSANVCNKGKP